MKIWITLSFVLATGYSAFTQTHPGFKVKNGTNVQAIEPSKEFDNIHVEKLAADSLSSSFLIWIKKSVPNHKHEVHSENVYVLQGEGMMTVGNEEFKLVPGSYIFIPANTPHAVTVDPSKGTMKVVSVQSPNFDGTDRVMLAPSSSPFGGGQ